MTIPNLLSFFRILLVPSFCIAYFRDTTHIIPFVIIILSGISDILDGFIARKFNQQSKLGEVLDPFADKLFNVSTVVCLFLDGKIHWIFPLIMISKEVFMIGGGLFLYNKKETTIPSKWYGKAASVLIFASFAVSFILDFFNIEGTIRTAIITVIFTIAIITSIFAVVNYTLTAVKINKQKTTERQNQHE